MELNAETRSVEDIFSPSNKRYVVPRFQREYSWQAEEVDEFWDDISQQVKLGKGKKIVHEEYFIGCIVLIGEDSRADHLIVDGQQRLTTLTILLRAIVDRLNELGEKSASKSLYRNVIEGTDNDGKQYFKLVNETPKPYFQNEIQAEVPRGRKKATTDEEILLQSASTLLKKRVNDFRLGKLTELENVKALRQQVLRYLKFILVTAKNEEDAYTIFETLNARGLGLTSVDLIKNWIFKNYNQTHPNDDAKDEWNLLRKNVSQFADLETFFRHFWNSKYAFASDDRLYKSFKVFLRKGEISDAAKFLAELSAAAELYRKIGAPRDADWPVLKEKPVKRSLDLLNQYRVTQVRPFLLALLECRERKYVDQSAFVRTVTNIENFHFIFSNICQDRASGLEGKYTRAAKNLRAAGSDKAAAKKVLVDLSVYLEGKKPGSARIRTSLEKLKFTSSDDVNKMTIRTVFAKIERSLQKTGELAVGEFSLEHIEDQKSGVLWVGSLGNLIPLDEVINNNIKAGASFSDKLLEYKKSRFKIVDDFISFCKNPWDEKQSGAWLAKLAVMLEKATELQKL